MKLKNLKLTLALISISCLSLSACNNGEQSSNAPPPTASIPSGVATQTGASIVDIDKWWDAKQKAKEHEDNISSHLFYALKSDGGTKTYLKLAAVGMLDSAASGLFGIALHTASNLITHAIIHKNDPMSTADMYKNIMDRFDSIDLQLQQNYGLTQETLGFSVQAFLAGWESKFLTKKENIKTIRIKLHDALDLRTNNNPSKESETFGDLLVDNNFDVVSIDQNGSPRLNESAVKVLMYTERSNKFSGQFTRGDQDALDASVIGLTNLSDADTYQLLNQDLFGSTPFDFIYNSSYETQEDRVPVNQGVNDGLALVPQVLDSKIVEAQNDKKSKAFQELPTMKQYKLGSPPSSSDLQYNRAAAMYLIAQFAYTTYYQNIRQLLQIEQLQYMSVILRYMNNNQNIQVPNMLQTKFKYRENEVLQAESQLKNMKESEIPAGKYEDVAKLRQSLLNDALKVLALSYNERVKHLSQFLDFDNVTYSYGDNKGKLIYGSLKGPVIENLGNSSLTELSMSSFINGGLVSNTTWSGVDEGNNSPYYMIHGEKKTYIKDMIASNMIYWDGKNIALTYLGNGDIVAQNGSMCETDEGVYHFQVINQYHWSNPTLYCTFDTLKGEDLYNKASYNSSLPSAQKVTIKMDPNYRFSKRFNREFTFYQEIAAGVNPKSAPLFTRNIGQGGVAANNRSGQTYLVGATEGLQVNEFVKQDASGNAYNAALYVEFNTLKNTHNDYSFIPFLTPANTLMFLSLKAQNDSYIGIYDSPNDYNYKPVRNVYNQTLNSRNETHTDIIGSTVPFEKGYDNFNTAYSYMNLTPNLSSFVEVSKNRWYKEMGLTSTKTEADHNSISKGYTD